MDNLEEILMKLAKRPGPPAAAARQVEEDPTWALSRARKKATQLAKKMPESRPERSRLQKIAAEWHKAMARRAVRHTSGSDPMQVARLIAEWGRPQSACVRLTDPIERELDLPGDYPIDQAREAARRLERFGDGDLPDGIEDIGRLLSKYLDLEDPVPVVDGPKTELSFLTNDRLNDYDHA